MHRAALCHWNLEGDYRLMDVESPKLKPLIESLIAEGFCGFNVTIPYKEWFFALPISKTPEAKLVGAVNTIKITTGGELIGHNTDLAGFMGSLTESLPDKLHHAQVIGSGGAARAAVWGLALSGFSTIEILARNEGSAHKIAHELAEYDWAAKAISCPKILVRPFNWDKTTAEVLVNATPIGLKLDDVPSSLKQLMQSMNGKGLFFDLVYSSNNKPTPLMAQARAMGIKAVDGIDMLIRQAALSFEFWVDKPVPLKVMQEALYKAWGS
jgi:shikimate dehydrogenase